MGKSTISIAIFHSFLYVHQRVTVCELENGHRKSEFSHEKLWFVSIIMLVYQRVMENNTDLQSEKLESGWRLSHPSEKWWSSSVGMMTFPIYGKIIQSRSSHHQPGIYIPMWVCLENRWISHPFLVVIHWGKKSKKTTGLGYQQCSNLAHLIMMIVVFIWWPNTVICYSLHKKCVMKKTRTYESSPLLIDSRRLRCICLSMYQRRLYRLCMLQIDKYV